MQIISKHWTDEQLKTPAKPVNASLIKKYTMVENYKGRADQIEQVMKYVTKENYLEMRKRVKELQTNDVELGSSNFCLLIKYLENNDAKWIEDINAKLES